MARRALLVATDRYADPGYQDLRAPVGDVEALQAALADPDCGAFEVRVPLVNRDEPALRGELEDFFDAAAYEDELLFYLSGHGELRGGRLFFATATTRRDRLRATALADSYIHELMDHSPARSIVLVLDCCHSGAFGKGIPKAPPEIELAERFGGSGRMTLAASAQIEYAFEGEAATATDRRLPGSVFTAALVHGLRRADANQDGVVTLDELYRFVSDEVRRRNPQQTPRLLGDRAGEIVMARVAGGPPGRLPEELGRHVESPLYYLRLGAAEELARLHTGRDRVLARVAEAALRTLADDPDRRVAEKAAAALEPSRSPHEAPDAGPPSLPPTANFERVRELARVTHDGSVWGVAFSPDGQRIATASDDNSARVWEIASGRELARVTHDAWVRGVAFSPDGQRIATASDDNSARVWEIASGRELARVTHDGSVWGVAFSPDGQRIASASADHSARVWEIASGRELARVTHDGSVWGVAFSPDGQRIATASADNSARVWEIASGRELARVTHDGSVWGVAFSPDGQRIASASADHSARVWEIASGRELARVTHDGSVWGVAFSPDGQRIATASDDNSARVWEIASGRELARVTHDDLVLGVAFSPDGQRIATACGGFHRIEDPQRGFWARLFTGTKSYGYATVWVPG